MYNINGLNLEDVRSEVPSIFATEPYEEVSDRYLYIPTVQILSALYSAGFVVTGAMQGKTRKEGKRDFTKHMLRLRRHDQLGSRQAETFELVLINSHDRTSLYDLRGGIYRMVCSNGLVVGEDAYRISVQHRGDILGRVVEGSLRLVEESTSLMERVGEMKQIQTTQPERLLLAQYAHKARFDDEDVPFPAEDLLRRHRYEDSKEDLWTVTNVVQENVIRGTGRKRYNQKTHQYRKPGSVNGITESVKLNSLVWAFSQEIAKLHTQA